jgi:poly(A) polymerase/tRNA nucleotidyltransferase (CCA-adding enzyme)
MFKDVKFPQGALTILKTLKDKGFKCFLVGGCVRDLLLNRKPEEWDLTTDATPEVVSQLFPKVVPTGIEFGTVTVLLNDQTFEVTTFRRDERYADGRHPSAVTYSKSLDEDLSRRDFTINALAYDPLSSEFVDRFAGQEDLKKKLIRTVGDPVKRFSEDGLRSVRACRFAAQLQFEIEKGTFEAISKTLEITKKVAPERVHDEIVKMLSSGKPSIGFEYMRRSGLLKLFLPELQDTYGVEQPPQYHKYDVYWHSLYSCDAAPADNVPLRLAALLHDIAKPLCKVDYTFYNHDKVGAELTERILRRLRFSNDDIKKVALLISNHMFEYTKEWSDAAVRRFMRRVGVLNLPDLFALRRADAKGMERPRPEVSILRVSTRRARPEGEIGEEYLKELRDRIDQIIKEEHALKISDLKVDGQDVMRELSIPPGPRVGKILEGLLERVLEDPALNQREKLLEMIREF